MGSHLEPSVTAFNVPRPHRRGAISRFQKATQFRGTAGTLMHEAGVPLKRAREILGHASERTTLAIYTHSMRRTCDASADKIAELAGL